MQKLVFINGSGNEIDLTSGNFGITNWAGLSNVPLNIQTQQVPFEDGAVFLDALMEQREIEVTVAIYDGNNLELRYQKKRELISALNPKLGEGTLIYTNDYLSRQIKAVPQIPLFENKNSNDAGTLKVSVAFTCCSPYWEDLEETEIMFAGSNNVVNNGDVPTQVEIIIPSNTESPTIINRRNGKKIELTEGYTGQIEINTNFGEKSVYGKEMKFKWINGSQYIKRIKKVNDKIFYLGDEVILVQDNITGEQRTVNIESRIGAKDVAYGNGIYVIVGNSGNIYTSADCVEWTKREVSNYPYYNAHIYCIIFAFNKFIADGLITSTDGITWTYTDIGIGAKDVIYAQNKLVMVGYGAIGTSYGGKMAVSTDGETWNVQPTEESAIIANEIISIAYGNGKFVAISEDAKVLTSTDGENWSAVATPNNAYYNSISFGNNVFIMVGYSNGRVSISTDGENWTTQYVSIDGGTDYEWWYISFFNNSFTATASIGAIMNTIDGSVWNTFSISITREELSSIAYGNGKFVAFSRYEVKKVFVSIDGEKWEEKNTTLGSDITIENVIYENGMFVAVGQEIINYYTIKGIIMTSIDGVSWNIVLSSDNTTVYNCIAYGNGKFIALGGYVAISTDGRNWAENNIQIEYHGITQNVPSEAITFGNGIFVSPDSGFVVTSPDGLVWTVNEIRSSMYVRDITFGNGLFVSVAEYGSAYYILYSLDGVDWTEIEQRNFSSRAIQFENNLFIAVSTDGFILISSDGLNWSKVFSGTFVHLNDITYGKDKFVIVGNYGTIITSVFYNAENLISKLTQDSDMTFNLEVGNNEVIYTSEDFTKATIKYRQKYIGV